MLEVSIHYPCWGYNKSRISFLFTYLLIMVTINLLGYETMDLSFNFENLTIDDFIRNNGWRLEDYGVNTDNETLIKQIMVECYKVRLDDF